MYACAPKVTFAAQKQLTNRTTARRPGPAFEVQTMPILEPTTVAVAAHPVATEVNSAVMATQATSELAAQCTAQLNATSQQELSARVEVSVRSSLASTACRHGGLCAISGAGGADAGAQCRFERAAVAVSAQHFFPSGHLPTRE